MENWKRYYMNNPHNESIDFLWKNVDIKCNSFWSADYKDHADLKGKALYLTRNLCAGISQRAQEYAKTTFGIILICGVENGDQTIKILWLFESKQIPKEFLEISDYDSFEWKNLNWKKDSDKKEIEAFLHQDQPIAGLQVIDNRVFR